MNKINEILSLFKENKLVKSTKKYLSLILIPFFIIYIITAINRSSVNVFNYQTFKYILLFLSFSLLISPIFILSKSLIFHYLKLLLGLRSSFKRSLNSVLFASSLDVFTPAKVNDFARLKDEENKKFALYAIFIERFLDISVLSIFLFLNKYLYIFILIFLALYFLASFLCFLRKSNKSIFSAAKLINGSIVISIFHWLIAFKLFKTSFQVILNSLNYDSISTISESITISKFSLVTIIGVMPISLGGFGLREAASIRIFDKIDPSVVFTSAIIYGLSVSGSISLIGIVYVNLKDRMFIQK